jgi:hypothetical protein
MIPFNRKIPNIYELMQWKRRKLKNPRTGRNIKKTGKIYNLLKSNYLKNFKNNYDYLDSVDNKDPVSLNKFWIMKDNKKIFIYKDFKNLIIYKDNNGLVRCIEKESLECLKAYKIYHHPITFERLPQYILDNTNNIIINNQLSINQLSLKVFKIFENISIYIDHNKFLNLNIESLKKLNYELKEFYYENISLENRIKIDGENGCKILSKKSNEFNNTESDELKIYLLKEIDKLLSSHDENLKYMLNYIILGALSLVIPEIKDQYPDFCFSF